MAVKIQIGESNKLSLFVKTTLSSKYPMVGGGLKWANNVHVNYVQRIRSKFVNLEIEEKVTDIPERKNNFPLRYNV